MQAWLETSDNLSIVINKRRADSAQSQTAALATNVLRPRVIGEFTFLRLSGPPAGRAPRFYPSGSPGGAHPAGSFCPGDAHNGPPPPRRGAFSGEPQRSQRPGGSGAAAWSPPRRSNARRPAPHAGWRRAPPRPARGGALRGRGQDPRTGRGPRRRSRGPGRASGRPLSFPISPVFSMASSFLDPLSAVARIVGRHIDPFTGQWGQRSRRTCEMEPPWRGFHQPNAPPLWLRKG